MAPGPGTTSDGSARFCPSCGTPYEIGAAFCASCGTPRTASGGAPAAAELAIAEPKAARPYYSIAALVLVALSLLAPVIGLGAVGLAIIGKRRNESIAQVVLVAAIVVMVGAFLYWFAQPID